MKLPLPDFNKKVGDLTRGLLLFALFFYRNTDNGHFFEILVFFLEQYFYRNTDNRAKNPPVHRYFTGIPMAVPTFVLGFGHAQTLKFQRFRDFVAKNPLFFLI